MPHKDVLSRADLEDIIARFYDYILDDPIIGYIFVDVAKIDLAAHLPIIVDFWHDIVLRDAHDKDDARAERLYHGNTLEKHLDLHVKLPLTPGHFTRWLYLFNRAVDARHAGPRADAMKERAELVAKSISAAITDQKKADMKLVLGS